jgi:hypothetical protein
MLLAAGCHLPCHRIDANIPFENPIPSFPKTMVGLWEAKTGDATGGRWLFMFEKDGSIKKIDHLIAGPIVIEEGGKSGSGSEPGTSYAFILGPCIKNYEKDILSLEVNIDYFEMVIPQGTLQGRQKDTFIGKVSGDGKTWEVDWRNYGWLEGAQEPDISEIDKQPQRVVFKKINLSGQDSNKNQ